MKKIIYLLSLSIVLISCKKKEQDKGSPTDGEIDNNLVLNNESKTTSEKKYFLNLEEFKKFIYNKKWVDLADESPCHDYARSITIKDGYLNEYNGIEPSKCKINDTKLVNSNTLEIKIKNNCNYGNTFKIEIIDLKDKLVKWTYFKGSTFNAKPYLDICKETKKAKPYYVDMYNSNSAKLNIDEKWKGLYYFKSKETEKEFIIDSKNDIIQLEVGGDQYGYIDQLKVVQVGDTLGLFHHENISGYNYDEDRAYDFLKFYKGSNGKFYFEGELPYLPKGAIEFEKVK